MEQQLLLAVQGSPSVVQVPEPGTGWQARGVPLQIVEQQSVPAVQLVPSALQAVVMHAPAEQLPEQQSRLEVQVPLVLQKGLWHLPLVQVPEQHCALPEQLL